MKNFYRQLLFFCTGSLIALNTTVSYSGNLPSGFVYLRDIDPSIRQDIRYATSHNFIGRPIRGYQAGECILTRPAATALAKVQKELLQSGLSLKVFDCYRPQMAVDEFIAWSRQTNDQKMKAEFYPRVDKADFFKLGYVAEQSGHSRGSTMDLTIVPLLYPPPRPYHEGQTLVSCIASYPQRFPDAGVDMGTGFDCMDEWSHPDSRAINTVAWYNRLILKTLMEKYGFEPLDTEWWHFTLKNEPYPKTYFNFPVSH
jgi:zinc D-Ala-D-Ala dipeptidase